MCNVDSISLWKSQCIATLIDLLSILGSLYENWKHIDGHREEDLIVDCSFDGKKCDVDETFYSPYYGNCFIINWNGSFDVVKPGSQFGKFSKASNRTGPVNWSASMSVSL